MNKTLSLSIVALLLLCALPLPAQEIQHSDTSSNRGRKALTFSFNGFNLGGGLGGTFWVGNEYALRVLLDFMYLNDADLEAGSSRYITSIGVTTYLKRHFQTNGSLSPYIGAGAGLIYDQYSSYNSGEISKEGWVTIPVIAGIEYWFTERISLSGEQSVGFRLYVTSHSRQYSISSSTSSLLLSVYF